MRRRRTAAVQAVAAVAVVVTGMLRGASVSFLSTILLHVVSESSAPTLTPSSLAATTQTTATARPTAKKTGPPPLIAQSQPRPGPQTQQGEGVDLPVHPPLPARSHDPSHGRSEAKAFVSRTEIVQLNDATRMLARQLGVPLIDWDHITRGLLPR
uniref:Uncharacterized protein n=1 Tax=Chlamydomonas euryale TaxID=1486919 RepID=A0A7R9VC82_9CHLO